MLSARSHLVNFASGDIVVLGQCDVQEALIVAKVEVSLSKEHEFRIQVLGAAVTNKSSCC